MADLPQVVVLTGAGNSAESGIRTFRDAKGLWEGHRIDEVATPEAFARDAATVQRFYDARRAQLLSDEVAPNAAHVALARLEAALGDRFLLVTQNVDDLHERAGSQRVIHMHGELLKARCLKCGEVSQVRGPLLGQGTCPACGAENALRPHIVWFGEMPTGLPRIIEALRVCDVFVSIGTSGQVYPAAGFVREARAAGALTVELNLEDSQATRAFHETHRGPATQVVPAWVDRFVQRGMQA